MPTQTNRMLSILALTFLMTGCTNVAIGPSFVNAPKPVPTSDKSIIYLYRSTNVAFGLIPSRNIYIDKKHFVALDNQGYTWIVVEPGRHEISFDKLSSDSYSIVNNPLNIDVEPNKEYFVHLVLARFPNGEETHFLINQGFATFYKSTKYEGTEYLKLDDKRRGMRKLQRYKYQPSRD